MNWPHRILQVAIAATFAALAVFPAAAAPARQSDGALAAGLNEASASDKSGTQHMVGGDFNAAVDDFNRAIAALDALPATEDPQSLSFIKTARAVALNGLGMSHQHLDHWQAAVDAYAAAVPLLNELNSTAGAGGDDFAMGQIYTQLGDYAKAATSFEEALKAFEKVGDAEQAFQSHNRLGMAYVYFGRYKDGMAQFVTALDMAGRMGRQDMETSVHNNVGAVDLQLGDYRDALLQFTSARDFFHATGDAAEGTALANIAEVEQVLGQLDEAIKHFGDALKLQQANSDDEGEATTYGNLAAAYEARGLPGWDRDALDAFQKALAIWQKRENAESGAYVDNAMGEVQAKLGNVEQARTLYDQALAIWQRIGNPNGVATAQLGMGTLALDAGKYEDARTAFEPALAMYRAAGDADGQANVLTAIGQSYQKEGNLAKAIDTYAAAIDQLEVSRDALKVEELAAGFAGSRSRLYDLMIETLIAHGDVERAFDYAERARARAMLDQLSNPRIEFRTAGDPKWVEAEREARRRIVSLQTALQAERGKAVDAQDPTVIKQLDQQLEEARRNLSEALLRLKLNNPDYAALVTAETVDLKAVQRDAVDAGTSLVAFYVLDGYVAAWVVEPEGFALVKLNIARQELRSEIGNALDLMRPQLEVSATLTALYEQLFAPLEPHLHHQRLVIIPHDVLHDLPFAALRNGRTQHYLLDDYTLAYAPSASVLKLIRSRRNPDGGQILAMAYPGGNLTHVVPEVNAVAAKFHTEPVVNNAATEARLRADAPKVDILHLAAHGQLDAIQPLYSAIQLAPADGDDGALEVQEIYGLDLTQVNLVVLSACETALGARTAGDDIVGLNRAFLYAGAPAVVTSLWSIDDAATAALMTAFYDHILAGDGYAEALRRAQLALAAQPSSRHPFYWAAFVVTGEIGGNLRSGSSPAPGARVPSDLTPNPNPARTSETVTAPFTATAKGSATASTTRGGSLCPGPAMLLLVAILLGTRRHLFA